MSKQTNQFFEQLKAGEPPGLLESIREAAGKVWDGATPMFKHGSAELISAMYAGHAHVMYMKGSEPEKDPNKEMPEIEQSLGREM